MLTRVTEIVTAAHRDL